MTVKHQRLASGRKVKPSSSIAQVSFGLTPLYATALTPMAHTVLASSILAFLVSPRVVVKMRRAVMAMDWR